MPRREPRKKRRSKPETTPRTTAANFVRKACIAFLPCTDEALREPHCDVRNASLQDDFGCGCAAIGQNGRMPGSLRRKPEGGKGLSTARILPGPCRLRERGTTPSTRRH